MSNLLESYKNRLAVSESVYQKSHNGAKMSNSKKLMIATVLNNTSKFLNESFTSAAATNRADIGAYKKFCLNISTVALPNLILPELMLTQPMTSITGFITYLKFTAGVTKGGVTEDTMFNSVYRQGAMDTKRMDYTSDRVVEIANATSYTPAWQPVVSSSVKVETSTNVWDDGEVTVDPETNVTTITNAVSGLRVRYEYNNVAIPQTGDSKNSIPTLNAKMESVILTAKARRIAVYYSQIAAFQAKTDYGTDIATELTTQAQGELAYEIDSEGVWMLHEGAEKDGTLSFPCYEDAVKIAIGGTYISRSQYYETFSEIFARAKQVIYKRTQKFSPNYAIVGSNIATILPYLKDWKAAPATEVNGPYFAGTVGNVKVFVSPMFGENEFVFGVNGTDLKASAAVYAPYMAIVPTQLLGFADGTMSQGFSTMYDMKLLSTYNEDGSEPADGETGDFSYLLVKGVMTDTSKNITE